MSINGTQLILNCIYDSVGFNRIKDDVLRHLVVARISQPSSGFNILPLLSKLFKKKNKLSRKERLKKILEEY